MLRRWSRPVASIGRTSTAADDGTEAGGVHDVAASDKTTPIMVVATREDRVHVLRSVGAPVEVKRWIEGDKLVWEYVGFAARIDRVDVP